MKSKENIAINYLFLNFPTIHALVFLPVFVGMGLFHFSEDLVIVNSDLFQEVLASTISIIQEYLIVSKMTLVALSSFFITYRWSLMEKNRNYGYWLTQGVNRSKFFLKSKIAFTLMGYFGVVIGLFLVIQFGGVALPTTLRLQLYTIVFVNTFLLISMAIFIGEIVANPELSLLTLLFIYVISFFISNNSDNFISLLFFGDLHFANDNYISAMIFSFILGIILFLISLRIHTKRGIDL